MEKTVIATKITALLDDNAVAYRLLPHDEPVFTVEAAAAQRGVVADEMVKSILLREERPAAALCDGLRFRARPPESAGCAGATERGIGSD